MSKSISFHKLGGPEVLQFEEGATPVPGKGEVRLRVEAVGSITRKALISTVHMWNNQSFRPSWDTKQWELWRL